jgi:hypothetical protein
MKCICGYEQTANFDNLFVIDSDNYFQNICAINYLANEDNKGKFGKLYVCPKCGTVKFVLKEKKV